MRTHEAVCVNDPARGLALSEFWIKILGEVNDGWGWGVTGVDQSTFVYVKPATLVVPNDPSWNRS